MRVKLNKEVLKKAINKASTVASQGIREGLEYTNRIKLKTDNSGLDISSTNGHLDFRWKIDTTKDPSIEVQQNGEIVVDAIVAARVVEAIGGRSETVVTLAIENDKLYFRDSKKSSSWASLPNIKECKEVDISKPRKPIVQHSFTTDDFIESFGTVIPFADMTHRKVKFHMTLVHFCKDNSSNEIRYITGNGSMFAVYRCPSDVEFENDIRLLMPIDQVKIISSVISGDSNKLTVAYKDAQTCYLESDTGIEFMLRGIPDEQYISYDKHAFRTEEAKIIIDVVTSDFVEACNLVGAVRDAELLKETFHSMLVNVNGDEMEMQVKEGKFNAEVKCPVTVYKISQDNFNSHYTYKGLDLLARSIYTDHLRFYGVDEERSMLAEPFKYDGATKDRNNIPQQVFSDSDKKLSFFFASVKDK